MGSFTEVVLGFSFKPDAPEHVLAAFSPLAVPRPEGWRGPPAPPLPAPHVIDPNELWEPTNVNSDPLADPAPWLHAWAGWLSSSASVSITPSAQLVWSEVGRWTLTCRWGIKSAPEEILPALGWLGPHLEAFELRPILLGYMDYGSYERPFLVWLTPDGRIEGENLNSPDQMW